MAIGSIGRLTTNVTTAQAAHTILTAATKRARLMEAGIFVATAVACTFALGRPAANGATATTPVLFQAEDVADPALVTNSVLAWTTSPTSPTNAHRRWNGPATIGVGVIFTFPRGILIAISSNYVLQNLATNTGGANSYFVIDE